MRTQVATFVVLSVCGLFVTMNITSADVRDIGTERAITVENYCSARGSGGRDGDGDGRYVAPNGYSILKAETIVTQCKRCSIETTESTQPGFVSLQQASSVNYGKHLEKLAEQVGDTAMSLRLVAVAALISNARVIQGTSHAVVAHHCHGESHKFPDHNNGWGYYDLHVTLLREPTARDYGSFILELIEATESGDKEKFKAVIELLK